MKKASEVLVKKVKRLNESMYSLEFESEFMAKNAKCGQFINIRCQDGLTPILRRPISICDVDRNNNLVRIVFAIKSTGTKMLALLKEGDSLDVLGPLGNGFSLDEGSNAMVVGGGIGIFPLLYLLKNLKCNFNASLLGFRNKDFVVLEDEFKECTDILKIFTDDGSYGEKGFVTQDMEDFIKKNSIDIIYACGPDGMLKSVKKIAQKQKVKCQISMEQRMGCGIGACLVCACSVKDETFEDGFSYSRVCKDGPVFWKEQLWEEKTTEGSEGTANAGTAPSFDEPSASVVMGLSFNNPVIAASGTFGFGREFEEFVDLDKLGGVCVKGLSLKPRKGNPPPRIAETPAGILNSVGLQNPGIENFIKEEIPFLRRFNTKIIANVSGNTLEEYVQMVERLSDSDIDAIELNVSCPNVKKGCMAFGTSKEGVFEVTKLVKEHCTKPLIVKLTPNVSDISKIALSAQEAGADAISLINTVLGLAIDIRTKRPILANNYGGLSGPAIKPIALRMVHQVSSVVNIPVIGMGGITTWQDALEFLIAGASLVMVGTANFIQPEACINIINGLEKYFKEQGIRDINEVIGCLRLN